MESMKRRDFLKALCISPAIPSVLMAKEKLCRPKYTGPTLYGPQFQKVYGKSPAHEVVKQLTEDVLLNPPPDVKWFTLKVAPENDPLKHFCEAAARELPSLCRKAEDDLILGMFKL